MPRNGSGTYTLPSGNPVVAGDLIEATWANNTLSDVANEITNSLDRNGNGGMLAPFRLADGTLGAPGVAWLNEPSTGFYRAGSGEQWAVVSGQQIAQFTTTGVLVPTGKSLTVTDGINNTPIGSTTPSTGAFTTLSASSGINSTAIGATTPSTGAFTTLSATGNVTLGDAAGDTVTVNGTATFGQTISGSISGNAGTVTNGVYTTGDQTIGGTKKFSGSVTIGGSGAAAVNCDVQTTGANVLTSAFTTGITDPNFRLGAMNGVSGGTAGTSQGKLGLFYLGTGEAATIDFRRGSTSTDGSIAFRTAGTDRATLDNSGNFVATGNVTAYSDERLKTNWQDFDADILSQLAKVKVGVYDRTDVSATQVGVSAQSLQAVLPNAVNTGEDGMLSVAYGNAALSMCVMLARKVEELEARLAKLEA